MGEHERFVCPMHPDVEQDGPGLCPKCGTELVPATTIGTRVFVFPEAPAFASTEGQ